MAPPALHLYMSVTAGFERSVESWRQEAACRGVDPAVFFPDTEEDAGPAKAICASCPVRMRCLDYALSTRQDDGIWGGLTETERRRARRRRQEAARAARKAGHAA